MRKIKTCWIYKNTVFTNWKKYSELKLFLVFIIDFLSCIPGSFDAVTSLRKGFRSKRAAAGLGAKWVKGENLNSSSSKQMKKKQLTQMSWQQPPQECRRSSHSLSAWSGCCIPPPPAPGSREEKNNSTILLCFTEYKILYSSHYQKLQCELAHKKYSLHPSGDWHSNSSWTTNWNWFWFSGNRSMKKDFFFFFNISLIYLLQKIWVASPG